METTTKKKTRVSNAQLKKEIAAYDAVVKAMAEETDELHPRIEKMRESIKAWTGHMDDLDLAMIEAYEATTDLGHGGNILADTLNKASKAEEERAAAVKKATEDALEEATAAEEERTDAIKKATEMNIADKCLFRFVG